MKHLDGKNLGALRQWRCSKDKNHVLGVTERVRLNLTVGDHQIRYYTTRLLIFRQAVDLVMDIPDHIDVCGVLDGKMLNMSWSCTVPGCDGRREWHPKDGILEPSVETYLAE